MRALALAAAFSLIHFAGIAQMPQPFPSIESAVEAALAHARARTQQPVSVVSNEAVTWNDGSLGCPREGMLYGQALTPGYRILLQAGDRTLHYHASARGALVLCPPGRQKEIPAKRDSR